MRAPALLAALAAAPLAGAAFAPVAAPWGLVPAAYAQGNPSANDIMNSLRPGGSMGGNMRGLGIAHPPAAEPSSPAPVRPGNAAPAVRQPSVAASRPAQGQGQGQASQQAGQPSGQQPAPSVNLVVQFANGSAELTPAAMRTLDELGQALSSQVLSSYRFRIEGHTDGVGTRDHNLVLSQQRAAKVVEYLTAKFNLDRGKLEAVGLGPDQPLVPTPANVPQPRNRRVTVVNLGV